MADPLTIIGSASAIVQLIGGVASGLKALKDAVVAIKDAPRTVKRLEDKIQHLGHCLRMLEKYFEQRPSKIPYETQLYELIQEIEKSCTEPLEVLQKKTPIHLSNKNAAAAFNLWLNDSTIAQAKTQIDEYIPYLNLLLQTLNLFKADQTDDLLRQIAASLNQTARYRLPSQDAAVYEINRHSFETTLKGIRAFANDTTALFVQSSTTAISSRYTSALRPRESIPASSSMQAAAFPKARRQLDHEWEQNRKDLERLIDYGLFENAEKIQQRALLIKEELSDHHGVPFTQEERDEMEERLADILIECKVEGSTEKAVSLIEKIIGENPRGRGTDNTKNLLTFPWSSTSDQKRLSLHYKLGRLYKEIGQMDLAELELRTSFNAYAEENSQDMSKIGQAGEELLELYQYRVEFGDTEHRPVYLSQLQGFRQELFTIMGQPLEQRRTTCDKALEWCGKEGIDVSTENGPRFDILDEGSSSPLHHAAERCQDDLALQQMMENSDTLENRDIDGDTPLLVAVGCSNTTALAVLLQKGASVKVRDRQQQTPLHRSQKPSVTKFLLHHRLRRASTMTSGLFDDARRFSSSSSSTFTTSPPNSISDQDLDIDAQDAHKKTALYLACSQGRDKIVRLLLLAGADPNIAAHDHTPLEATIESQAHAYIKDPKKKVDIVAALVSRRADPEAGKRLLRSPRGMQKEILKALEGRYGSQLLQPKVSEDLTIMSSRDSAFVPQLLQPKAPQEVTLESDRDSAYVSYLSQPKMPEGVNLESRRDSSFQPPFSPIASKPQLEHLEFGPAWSAAFTPFQSKGEQSTSRNLTVSGEFLTGTYYQKETNIRDTSNFPSAPPLYPAQPGPSTEGQHYTAQDSSPPTTFSESSSESGYSEESAIDVDTITIPRGECGDLDTADLPRLNRFDNPELWQRRLLGLESAVRRASFIGCYIHYPSPLFARVDDYTLRYDASLDRKTYSGVMSSEREQLLSMATSIEKNIGRLSDAGYCGDFISLIVADTYRTNVATLNCISLSDIVATTSKIEVAFTSIEALRSEAAVSSCKDLLMKLGVTTNIESVIQAERRVQEGSFYGADGLAVILSRIVLQILDLSILSYCGAHLEPLHEDFPTISGTPRLLLSPGVSLSQRKLRCLDQLLERPVWVFEIGDAVARRSDSTGLWLSTTVEAFADIWGPAWPVEEPEQPYTVARYDVGRGSIIGWKRAPDEPDTMDDEVFCHWISALNSRPAELCVGGELKSKRLLIGGRLTTNDGCALCPQDFTAQMQDKNRLSDLGVGQRQWYTDARTLSWSLGGLGITAGAQETYKRRNESYRDALSTALQKDDFDSTLCVLRRRCIVEISACTGLARRQSVLYALQSPGMENYLKKSDMEWDDDDICQYFDLLRKSLAQDSLDDIRTRLKEDPFGGLIKKALKKSFCNVLLTTGRPRKAELAAFWSFEREGGDGCGVLISYPSWDYSWTGLLHEGSLGFNAAMVSPICLELHKRKHPSESLPCAQRPCPNNNRYTLLETLLFVNKRELEPPKGLRLVTIDNERSHYAERWSVRDIVGGEVFHLGEQGRLKILGRMKWLDSGAKRSGLLAEWNDPKSSRLREATQEIRLRIGRTPEPPCHREHLEPGRGDRSGPAPIIIHVVSHANFAMGR